LSTGEKEREKRRESEGLPRAATLLAGAQCVRAMGVEFE